MEYAVAESGSCIGIVDRVQQMMLDGWKPVGGLCLDSSDRFYQAMTRGIWEFGPLGPKQL